MTQPSTTSDTVQTPYLIKSSSGEEFRGTLVKQTWSQKAAIMKGAQWWLAMWILATICLFIPIIHFIATPAALIAGPLLGILMYRLHNGKTDLEITAATCPKCKAALDLPRSEESWPVRQACSGCHSSYEATLV